MKKDFLTLLFIIFTLTSTAAQAQRQPPVIKKDDAANVQQQPSQTTQTTNDKPEEIGEEEIVRVNTSLVTVPLSVMDRDGRYVGDISREEFRIYEDGAEQEIAFFASLEKPFTVALLLDVSDSAVLRLEEVKAAAIAFVDQLRADDRAIVVAFDRRMTVLAEATSDKEILRRAIEGINIGAGTSLYNAIDMTLKQLMNPIEGRKAIVLFTDGVDTSSMGANYDSTLRDAAESDSLVYTVQYELSPAGKRYNVQASARGVGWSQIGVVGRTQRIIANKYLFRLAEKTGGRQYIAGDVEALRKSFASIAEELRHQYSLGYYPQRQRGAGQQRLIKVRVNRSNLVVRARRSYLYNPAAKEKPDEEMNQR